MKRSEANIEIRKDGDKVVAINVAMPIWDKFIEEDNVFSVDMPLFGMKTWAKNQEGINVSVREAIGVFAINSERFGKGMVAELRAMGWQILSQDKNSTALCFGVSDRNDVIHNIFSTGENTMQSIDLTPHLAAS